MYCDRQELIVIVHTIFTVRLTLIDHPQMGGKFTVTPGGLTQLILWLHWLPSSMIELVNSTMKHGMAPLEVGPGFAPN